MNRELLQFVMFGGPPLPYENSATILEAPKTRLQISQPIKTLMTTRTFRTRATQTNRMTTNAIMLSLALFVLAVRT